MNDHVIHVLTTNKMFKIACTRFTDITIMENYRYRETRKIPCIYCSPVPISETHRRDTYLFVFEMNNTTNQIMGIGLIQNVRQTDRTYIIYNADELAYNFNRYIYRGNYWLSRDQLPENIVEIFDKILFKGKTHLKRMINISVLTNKLFAKWEYNEEEIINQLKQLFSEMCSMNFNETIDKI